MSYHFKHQTDDRDEMLDAIEEAPGLPAEVRALLHGAVLSVPTDQWDAEGEWAAEVNGHQCAGEGSYRISTLNMRVGPAA